MRGLTCTQNLSLNIAEKGFPISVFNRSYEKTEAAVVRAGKEGAGDARCQRKLSCTLRPELMKTRM